MLRYFLMLLFACGFSMDGWASPELSGRTRFQFGAGNATVEFGADAIVNSGEEGTTGTIKVQLWALNAPYSENGLRGTLVAGFQLEGLEAGSSYRPARQNLAAKLPPRRGTYYIALIVSEYDGSQYVVTDYRNFDPVTLAPAELFQLSAPWRWQSHPDEGTLDLRVRQISHTRPGATGSLRLSLWATEQPYVRGRIRGYELGRSEKRALSAGRVYNNVFDIAEYTAPPSGEYYVTLFLTEFDGSEYVIRAWLPSSETTWFD